ncbi:MAG: DNA (cytosine-5-)-methyltransferase [Victivallales bacterium]|nr:DNA (cytosine-5-)-methyltransferase [Victivallales bacterium]
MNKFRTVDLFCGGGGLSQGLQDAGFEVVAAYDWWLPAIAFYNQNQKGHFAYQLDLSNVDEAVLQIQQWQPTVIVGGPPCQDFSSAGKRDESGGRASLTTVFAKIVEQVHPQLFVMENVDRALKTKTYREALDILSNAGYHLTIAILDASLCGVPQKRKRAVVVGTLRKPAKSLIEIYKEKQSVRPMTVRDYFGDSLGIEFYYRHPRSYVRRGVFSIDEPSPTIRGVNRPIPKGYAGHPGDAIAIGQADLRPLTTKERSLIQTFPKEWELVGNKSDLEQIIGNAVPVKLGEFIGKAIKTADEIECLVVEPSEAMDCKYSLPHLPVQQWFVFEQAVEYKTERMRPLC